MVCRVCDQRYQSKVNREYLISYRGHCADPSADLTEPIDIYSEWIDAADAAQREEQVVRRDRPPASSSTRPAPAPRSVDSDDDE